MNTIIKIIFNIKDSKRLPQLTILASFLLTFTLARYITTLQRLEVLPNQANDILHIHHLVPGIILLIIAGYFGLSFWNHPKFRILMSFIFGMGAALTIDEFALWLHLRDVYWEKEGRASIDALIITTVIFTILFVISEIHDHRHIKKIFGIRI